MTEALPLLRKPPRRALYLALLALCFIGQTACTKSIRQDAIKVAQAGSVTARQAADYYDSLVRDNIRIWELHSFSTRLTEEQIFRQTGRRPPATDLKPQFEEYRKRNDAFVARRQMVDEVQAMYEGFAKLADYDAAADVSKKLGDLSTAIQGVIQTPLPGAELATAILRDIFSEIERMRQNKIILSASRKIIPILERMGDFFKSEMAVYKSIAADRAAKTTDLAKSLVSGKAVVSTALVNDVLTRYELKWPEPQTPFADEPLIAGINGMIEARAKPLEQASKDAADKLYASLTKLIALHKQLENRQPLSFSEWAETSATVQVLLAQLKEKNVPADDILNFLKLISKEK